MIVPNRVALLATSVAAFWGVPFLSLHDRTAVASVGPREHIGAPVTSTASGAILGLLLNSLADRIDVSVEKAGTRADETFIRAGSEANAAINNIRAAYPELLDQTIDKLDVAGTTMLTRVQAAAAALEGQTANDAMTLSRMVAQDLLLLPLSNKRPQVTLISPTFEVAAKDAALAGLGDSILVQIHGIFPGAGEPGLKPTLSVGAKRVPALGGTQDLTFVIPRSVLSVASGHTVAYARMKLDAPYTQRCGFLYLSHCDHTAAFTFGLIGLPASPGKLEVQTSRPATVTDLVHVTTMQYNVQSDRDDHDLVVCGPNEDAPRSIVPGSVKMQVDRKEGSTSTDRPVRTNNPSVCWHWRTEHHGVGTSDKVWFHFEYDVTVPRQTVATATIPLSTMKWGDSRVVDLNGATYKLVFDAFDGTHNEYSTQTQSDRYITMAPDGAGLRVAARPVTGILPVAR